MSVLEVRDLCVNYGGVRALQGISLELEEGSVRVVIGSNGAGKSSLINAISGIARSASGSIIFNGQDISRWPAHKIAQAGVIQVPEGRRIFAPLSVEDNLLTGAYGVRSRAQREEILARVYELFPILLERRTGIAGYLSGGQQQMLAFGRALMGKPSVLLLDEPSMGLAPVMVDTVIDTIGEIAQAQGHSILLVEQNANAAFSVASYGYVLENGSVVLEGKVDSIADDPIVLRAFLGINSESTTELG